MSEPNQHNLVPEEDDDQTPPAQGSKQQHEGMEEDQPQDQMDEEGAENEDQAEQIDMQTALENLEREFRMTHDPQTAAELIEIYQNSGSHDNVRRIREALLEYTTLSESCSCVYYEIGQWLGWLEDEIAYAKSDEEKKAVLKLFDRALDETLYFDVAKLAISYVKGLFTKGIVRRQGVKLTIEKIINWFCYDFDNAARFFKKLRKFEMGNGDIAEYYMVILEYLFVRAERDKFIRNVYERQLKLPHAQILDTFQEYRQWEKNNEELKRINAVFQETCKEIDTHLDFEEKFNQVIDEGDPKKLGEVLGEIVNTDKLKLEKKLNMFERCIVTHAAEEKVWEKYIDLAEKNLKSTSAQEKVYRRAAKNCPKNMQFTLHYLRVLEKMGTETEKLKDKVLATLWNFSTTADYYALRQHLCEVYVRSLNTKLVEVKGDLAKAKEETIKFRQAVQEAIQFFSSKWQAHYDLNNPIGDQSEENQGYVANFWLFKAQVETYTLKDKQQMNQSMDKYVQHNGSLYSAWNLYVTYEQALGRPDTVRRILKRGCEYTKDDIQAMYKLAIDYERKFGNLDDLENMEKRYKEKVEKMIQEGLPVNLADVNNPPAVAQPKPVPKKGKEKDQVNKRKHDDVSTRAETEEVKYVAKKVKKNEQAGSQAMEQEETKQEQHPNNEEDKTKGASTGQPQHLETISYPEELDKKNTVFVKNFPPTLIEADLKALFPNPDKILDCRLVRDKGGKSKCMAYVDFQTREEADLACQTNISIDGQKLFVAFSDPPKKGKDDRKTLFLNNLPFDIKRETLAETFKHWEAHITDIRIPTVAGEKAKGFAYIVFDSEELANEAMEKNHNLHVGGRKVNIEHANSSKHHSQQTLKALHVAFIKNLSFKVTEEDIYAFFNDFNVKQVHLVRDKKSKKPTGIAFVEFHTMNDLKRAISIPEPKILDREIYISKSDRPITQSNDNEEGDSKNKKPKALSRKDVEKKEEPVVEAPVQKKAETAPPSNPSMRSNNDFRALLMKKK